MSIKTAQEIAALVELGKRHAAVVDTLAVAVKPGVTTQELEALALSLIEAQGAVPAFKNYRPFGADRPYPCALCVAPNDVVVHGIPTELNYTLRDGDIIGIDIGLKRDGVITDAGRTVPCGTIDAAAQRLLAVTEEAMMLGIHEARVGNHVGDIGYAIETYVRGEGYGLVRDLCGHGVGRKVHEEPQIPNFGAAGTGPRLVAGMVLAIEPMVNEGKGAVVFEPDGYTVRTRDGSRSAHFEHDVVVTDGDPIILTKK
jgi:methionyl aminopeptidase